MNFEGTNIQTISLVTLYSLTPNQPLYTALRSYKYPHYFLSLHELTVKSKHFKQQWPSVHYIKLIALEN